MYQIIAPRLEEGLVRMLKSQPGFRCYCAFVSEDGDGVSVTVFDDRERATLANERVREWGRDHVRDFISDRPEVSVGECDIAEVAREPGAGQHQPPVV